MIRYIIHVISSKPDIYGNRWHYARVTSTKTGKELTFRTEAPSNARAHVNATVPVSHSETYYIESELAKRYWNEAVKGVELYEHHITADMLRALERKERKS